MFDVVGMGRNWVRHHCSTVDFGPPITIDSIGLNRFEKKLVHILLGSSGICFRGSSQTLLIRGVWAVSYNAEGLSFRPEDDGDLAAGVSAISTAGGRFCGDTFT